MPRIRTIQHSFNAGEWSPRLDGRSDLQKYSSALATCENFIALKYGGVTRRPGTRYVKEVKHSDKTTGLIPFQFSTAQAYIVEVGDSYFRFYKNDARIESPPGTAVEIVSPYAELDVPALHYVQSADVLYLTHLSYTPKKLSRTSDTVWTLTDLDFLDGPYLDERTDLTITPSATTGSVTLTASSAIFQSGHVGSVWRLKHGTTWSWLKVTAYTNSTHVTATVRSATTTASASDAFREGSWSGVNGYPATVSLHQQRLIFGHTNEEPDTFWESVSADYENFSPSAASDADAIDATLASNAVNAIQWIAPSRSLLIGTAGQEWQVTSTGPAITPSDIDAKPETTYGSASVQPIQAHNAALFLQRSQRVLRELSFDFNSDAYVAPDLTLLAEHLTKTYQIQQLAYQQIPESIVWAVRTDGQLLGMTYERTQDVIAWHRHIFGGTYNDGSPHDAMCKAVAVIPHPDGDRDQVWVIVQRTINGATKQYIEYLDDKKGYYGQLHTDAAVQVDLYAVGIPTGTITGLSHLEGQTVDVIIGGAVFPQKVVSGGQITGIMPLISSKNVEVGLHYDSDGLTMRPEVPTGSGTAQGARKRYSEVVLRLNESLGGTVNGEDLSRRDPADPMGSPPSVITDDVRAKNLGWDRAGRIRFQQTQPLPMTILCIVGTLSLED